MKSLFVLLLFAAMCLQLVATESINWKDIGDKTQIIGKLGIPLGTVAEIEATVVGIAEFPQPLLLLQLSVSGCAFHPIISTRHLILEPARPRAGLVQGGLRAAGEWAFSSATLTLIAPPK